MEFKKREECKQKSRDQKFNEFYESLQLEFIVAELRHQIYPDGFRRDKALEIMEGKKVKILDISIRNRSKTIFEGVKLGLVELYSEKLRDELYRKVIPEFGVPNFLYRDKVQYDALHLFDMKCWLKLGTEFMTKCGKVGTLIQFDLSNNTCIIKINNKNNSFDLQCVTRNLKK